VSDGLSYLHAAKVVHGDINNVRISILDLANLTNKLSKMNILISHDRRAQIADFGLTIVGDVTVGRMSTRKPGSGTVRWMSPERLLSDEPKRLERSDDVYAFGGLIYMVSVSLQRK
jgi:serine/threonine protein kinase